MKNWKINAFIALGVSIGIASHSILVQKKLAKVIIILKDRLSYYEWDDGTKKWRCAKCGIQPDNHRKVKYGAMWCRDCCP